MISKKHPTFEKSEHSSVGWRYTPLQNCLKVLSHQNTKRLTRGVTRGLRRGTMPQASNHWGGLRRKVPTMSKVLSSIQHICFRKLLNTNMGAPNLFVSRTPSNLGTPLRLTHFVTWFWRRRLSVGMQWNIWQTLLATSRRRLSTQENCTCLF